jgi:hypothetical protein
MNRMTALANEQVEPQEDGQAKVERLEKLVCELLMKNQRLRMALESERARVQSSGYFYDFSANFSNG